MLALVTFREDKQRAAEWFWPQRHVVHWPRPTWDGGTTQTASCACKAFAKSRALQCMLVAFQVPGTGKVDGTFHVLSGTCGPVCDATFARPMPAIDSKLQANSALWDVGVKIQLLASSEAT